MPIRILNENMTSNSRVCGIDRKFRRGRHLWPATSSGSGREAGEPPKRIGKRNERSGGVGRNGHHRGGRSAARRQLALRERLVARIRVPMSARRSKKEALHREEEPEPNGTSVLWRTNAVTIDPGRAARGSPMARPFAYDRLLWRPVRCRGNCPSLRMPSTLLDDALRHKYPALRLVVIGSGFIGLELAASVAKRGAAVAGHRGAARAGVDARAGGIACGCHRAAPRKGVDIATGAPASRPSGRCRRGR